MRLPFVITRFPSQSTGRPRQLIISQNKAINSSGQRKNMPTKTPIMGFNGLPTARF